MSQKVKILIADDHQLVLEGITQMIREEPAFELVGTANNGSDVLKAIPVLQPELVLLDLDMPVLNGIETSTLLQKEHPEIKVAILSMHYEKAIIEKMMQLGVQGYFVKNKLDYSGLNHDQH